MGIFSSDKETVVSTAINRVIEDTMVPDTLLSSVLESIILEQDIVKNIQQKTLFGPYRNFERMYRYAAKGDYHFGLPNAELLTTEDGIPFVQDALNTLEGVPVKLQYVYFRPANSVHIAWQKLTEEYGYDHSTNEITSLSATKGTKVYLDDLVAVYPPVTSEEEGPENTSRGLFGDSPRSGYTPERPARAESTGLGKYSVEQAWTEGPVQGINIHHVWADPSGELQHDSIFIDLSSYGQQAEYYHARYEFTDSTGKLRQKYWTYLPGTGTFPALDEVYVSNYVDMGTYFPFALLRRNYKDRTEYNLRDTDEFKTTEKLLKYIDIDFIQMGEAINENPSIGDVVQAAMIMAVPANTENPAELEYLFEYFTQLSDLVPEERPKNYPHYGTQPSYAVRIKDADFSMVLSFNKLKKRIKAGNIGAVDTITNTWAPRLIPGGTSVKTRCIRKQITENAYIELQVDDLKLRYEIYDGESIVARNNDDNLLIPLDRNIAHKLSILDREKLYYRSLHIVFNSAVEHEIKWYQKGIFRAILMIIAIVVTIWSGGSAWQSIVTAAGVGAGALAIVLLTIVLKAVVIRAVLDLVAKELGADVALILAVVAAVWGGAKAFNSGGIGQDVWAKNLLSAATGLAKASSKEYASMIEGVQEELSEFQDYAEGKWAELEEVNDLLDIKNLLNPFVFVGQEPLTLFGESPDDYYSRTVHSGNVGVRSTEIIENFVNLSIKLPTIEDTLGENSNGN